MDYKTMDEDFKSEVEAVWLYKLYSEYRIIESRVFSHMHRQLKEPVFCIDWDMGNLWGEWNPNERTIRLNARLFRDYEWEAVVRILKHEIGHQIVSEIFDGRSYGCSHGEHWKIACEAIGLENISRCDSAEFLAGLKSNNDSSMADKVRKLLAKGSCEGATQEEQQLFLNKAQEIMLRHQLTMLDVTGNDVLWVKRPVGPLCKQWKSWLWRIADILRDHYNVKALRCYAYKNGKRYKYLELFGEPANVDVAEYVFYALYNNAKWLWKEAYKEHKRLMKEDDAYASQNTTVRYNFRKDDYVERASRFTEASFMTGLFNAFNNKLNEKKNAVVDNLKDDLGEEEYENQWLVACENEKLLDEMYNSSYDGLRTYSSTPKYSLSRGSGVSAASRLKISAGVKAGQKGRMLT